VKKYGIPYQGSKNKILGQICRYFPKADHFYDIFGGGFSVTHFMAENRANDYKEFHYNEIRKDVPRLIKDAIKGRYSYSSFKPEWISREDFNRKKDTDAYVACCWSFGNNFKYYLFSPENEKTKKSLHNAVVFNVFDDFAKDFFGFNCFPVGFDCIKKRRLYINQVTRERGGDNIDLQQLQQLQQLERLGQLERLEQLGEKITLHSKDYRDIRIKKNSIIYLDPPYIGTADYGSSFNHKEFYDWAASIDEPVFISEYSLDDSRFFKIANFKKRSLMSRSGVNNIKDEGLWVNKKARSILLKR